MARTVKLGVNIDHVATLRNARGGINPSVLRAAEIVKKAGGDGITIHLREDRRHIRDGDVTEIRQKIDLPLNLELAATDEMQAIALKVKPDYCCIVPERREELTTEGGLDVVRNLLHLKSFIIPLKNAGIKISLFIDADISQVEASKEAGADIVEFHTGKYCHRTGMERKAELDKIIAACKSAEELGIISNAGHGLDYETVPDIVKIPQINELNIGHFIIGEAVFEGLPQVIKKMRKLIRKYS